MRYFVYARKSSEDEEKQALSIDSQLGKIRELFGSLDIVDVVTESVSAFKPEIRTGFASMVTRIKNGEGEGIISWHPDRLSRNEVDAANLTYMLRTGALQDLKFGSYNFDNSPEGIMMLQMVMSHSQYFSAKLSKDVKRGLETKIRSGWYPGPARMGYLNTPDLNKGMKKIVKDPERFALVRMLWDLMLTGQYTIREIVEIANSQWGFTSPKKRKTGGRPLAKSTLYDIYTSPFYAGLMLYKGEIYEGRHEPMITLAEFDRVQTLLGRNGKPRPKKHYFAFTGLIKCGECGSSITAEVKSKYIKSVGETRTYVYYHCTWKKPCSQRKVVREEEIERQIDSKLSEFTILPEFREWALQVLNETNDVEIESRSKIHASLSRALLSTQQQLDNLTRLRYRDLIKDDEFIRERKVLELEKRRLSEELRDTEHRADEWLELTEKTFDFATYARHHFATGDIATKKEILMALGEEVTLLNGKLDLPTPRWLVPIAEGYPALEIQYNDARTKEFGSIKEKTAVLTAVHSQWLRRPDSNRQPID